MALDPFIDLERRLPDQFSRTVLAGAIAALRSDNPLRAHHFATSIRELIGHILHTLAPDASVVKADWYRAEDNKPTRRQRATYAVQGGMSDSRVEALGFDIADMHKQLSDAGLTDILYQADRDYMIADVPSRWDIGGASVCGAGGRYRSDECGLTVL